MPFPELVVLRPGALHLLYQLRHGLRGTSRQRERSDPCRSPSSAASNDGVPGTRNSGDDHHKAPVHGGFVTPAD